MVGFTAKLELPRFIPIEEILGKHVFDSGLVHVGITRDWTYSPDGQVKLVVQKDSGSKSSSIALIPFSHLDRVGQVILLKTSGVKYTMTSQGQAESEEVEKEREEAPENRKLKYADEIDQEKLNALIRKIPPST